VKHILDENDRKQALEKQAVLISLENLKTFPFIKVAMAKELLTLHGLWTDIGKGDLEHYIEGEGFIPI